MSSTDDSTQVTTSTDASTTKVVVSMPIKRLDRVDTILHDVKVEFFRHYHYERDPPEVDVTTTQDEANRLTETDENGKPKYEGVHLVKQQ